MHVVSVALIRESCGVMLYKALRAQHYPSNLPLIDLENQFQFAFFQIMTSTRAVPVDCSKDFDTEAIRGKTAIVTGGMDQ